jgi:hypothetical protein
MHLITRLNIAVTSILAVASIGSTISMAIVENNIENTVMASAKYGVDARYTFYQNEENMVEKQWDKYFVGIKHGKETVAQPSYAMQDRKRTAENFRWNCPNKDLTLSAEKNIINREWASCWWLLFAFLGSLVTMGIYCALASIVDNEDFKKRLAKTKTAWEVYEMKCEMMKEEKNFIMEERNALTDEIKAVWNNVSAGRCGVELGLYEKRVALEKHYTQKAKELGGRVNFWHNIGSANIYWDLYDGRAVSLAQIRVEAKLKANMEKAEEEVSYIETWEDTFTHVEKEIAAIVAAQTEVIEQQVWHDVNASIANAEVIVATIGK